MTLIIVFGLILLISFGVSFVFSEVRIIKRRNREDIEWRTKSKKALAGFFSINAIVVIETFGSLYWLIDCYLLDDIPYRFSLDNTIEDYGYFGDYILLGRLDAKYSSDPIIFIQHKEDSLSVCMIKTRKMLIGLEKYWVRGGIPLIDGEKRFGYSIDESNVNGGAIQVFPNIWFGIIYPDNRDRIRINGNVPEFYDINFNGADYVFWYIEKDGEEAVLSFR